MEGRNSVERSGNPVGQHCQDAVRLLGIIAGQVNTKIVLAVHAFVHGELHGDGGAFAGL